jgi:penicillin-binding protein 2
MIDLQERFSERKNFFNRLLLVYIFFTFLFGLIIFRTYTLQVSSFSDYEIAALENKTREMLVQPKRGIIYDRHGEIIVNNTPSYNLIIQPSFGMDLDILLEDMGSYISFSDNEIKYAYDNYRNKASLNRELVLKQDLTQDEIARFEVRRHRHENVFIAERFSRQNLYPKLFAHSIGYIGSLNNEDLENILVEQSLQPKETIFNYLNGYIEGKTGIENIYDKSLRGKFGKRIYEVDATGKLLNLLEEISPINGTDISTSLDLESQKTAFIEMKERRGAVVAVELATGAIVTYLSSPSFSANKIANGLSQGEFEKLISDKDKPFFDRAVQGRYSPASTIKPAIGLFGIEKGIIDWDYTMNDPGFFELPEDNRIYRGWKKGGHGNINLNDAIIESSNTFFFSLAYESNIDELIKHLGKFGFGRNVCIDCFLPDSGLLPNPRWKMNTHNFGWYKGDTVNLGVGQGYLSATPIQLAYYSALLANKGSINKLSFVQGYSNPIKDTIKTDNIYVSDWNKIHQSMIGVIDNPKGTAGRLRSLKDYTIAAKSGTVELVSTETKEDYKIIRENEGNRDHAIIIAFGPMPNPKYAVSVVIENGESGGSVAGPVAIAVMNTLVKND